MRDKEYREVLEAIAKKVVLSDVYEKQPFIDYIALMRLWTKECRPEARADFLLCSKAMRNLMQRKANQKSYKRVVYIDFVNFTNDLLQLEAPFLFDSYMLFLETNRMVDERFYLPRRKILKPIVDDMQALVNGELDELFLSLPPRVGKTSLVMFFVTWLLGKDSEKSNLYSAYSDIITGAFYNGVMEVINDKVTYRWHEVFPTSRIVSTNAKEEILNVDRKKRYPSLTCRSLYGTLNGACDCNGVLIGDDLIGGIEEALNKDRLASAWTKVDNNLLPRAKEQAKVLWIGTRWSIADPIGLRIEILQSDPKFKRRKYKIINIPALDEKDESNFDYLYGVGYSTLYYQQRRASFEKSNDMASWNAQYMGEPIEREGTLFTPDDMKYYNGVLPSDTPDRIFMPVDVAWGGGDFLSAPVFVQFGDICYIPSVVFDKGDKTITRPKIINQILKYKIQACRFEKNNGGDEYKEYVEKELAAQGYKLNITSKNATQYKGGKTMTKEMRIFDKAPEIRELYFLESKYRDKDYTMFMQNLFSFKIQGKNKNDDAPDSLAMGLEMKDDTRAKYQILDRFF